MPGRWGDSWCRLAAGISSLEARSAADLRRRGIARQRSGALAARRPARRPTPPRSSGHWRSSTAVMPAPARRAVWQTWSRPRPIRPSRSSGCWPACRPRLQAYIEIPLGRGPVRSSQPSPVGGAAPRSGPAGVTAEAFPPAARPRPLHSRLPRRRRAVQGHRRPASSAARRVSADLCAGQPLRHHVSDSSTCSSPPSSWRHGLGDRGGGGSCSRSGIPIHSRWTDSGIAWRGRRVDPSTRSRGRARDRHRLVRLLLIHRADRRPAVSLGLL